MPICKQFCDNSAQRASKFLLQFNKFTMSPLIAYGPASVVYVPVASFPPPPPPAPPASATLLAQPPPTSASPQSRLNTVLQETVVNNTPTSNPNNSLVGVSSAAGGGGGGGSGGGGGGGGNEVSQLPQLIVSNNVHHHHHHQPHQQQHEINQGNSIDCHIIAKLNNDHNNHLQLTGKNNEALQFLSKGGQVIVRMRGLPYDCTNEKVVSKSLI